MSDLDLEDDLAFGVIAIELGLLSRDQLTDALALQVADRRSLGRILVHQGWLSEARAQEVLALQLRRRSGRQEGAHPSIAIAGPAFGEKVLRDIDIEETPAESAPGVVRQLVAAALRHSASTIHLHAGLPPYLRIHGELRPLKWRVFEAAYCLALARALLDDAQRRELEERGQIDLAADVEGLARLRVNVYRQQRGVDLVLRLIQREVPTLESLCLPDVVGEIATLPRGMALFTGPGGCGKSTTMAAVVDRVNATRAGTILTIEDPVEFVHPSRKSVVRQRQVGRDASSFARALRAALRQDPNVIVIGELRDRETIAMALTAAETGHLVLASLTTSNAVATISRLVGVFPPDQQRHVRTMLGESLRAVVSQRLLRRADGKGCVAAFEILLGTPAAANLIRENKLQQIPSILQGGAAKGMSTLDASLGSLVAVGAVDRAEAALHAESRSAFVDVATGVD